MLLIKRYPNRKLYNTAAKQYITLEGIANLVRQGAEIRVTDHATGEDLSALTLTQIILEHEKRQDGLLSHSLLASLIRAGSDHLTALRDHLIPTLIPIQVVDNEIERRIKSLIEQGLLDEVEGQNLLQNLLKQGKQVGESRAPRNWGQLNEDLWRNYLEKLQIPTQDDLHKINDQIEELAAKIENVLSKL